MTVRARLALALLAGALAASFHYHRSLGHPSGAVDWDSVWLGGRALLAGQEPYAVVSAIQPAFPLYYPLTAVAAMLPLAVVPLALARAVFIGGSTGLLVYGLSGRRWMLPAILTPSFLHAYYLGQWTPLLTAAALLPPLGVVLAAKPTVGLAIALMHPERWRWPVIGGAMLLVLSVLLRPDWPAHWLASVHDAPQYTIPILRPWGWLLLLAALRWRAPEGRLMLALALVPGNPSPYELLPVFLVARAPWELLVLVALNWLTVGYCFNLPPASSPLGDFANWWLPMLVGFYAPAVALVLFRLEAGRGPRESEQRPVPLTDGGGGHSRG